MSAMRVADGSAPNRSLSSPRISESERTGVPVTVIFVIRLTGISCQRSPDSLLGRRGEDAHIFEAPEPDQVIDRAADIAHA